MATDGAIGTLPVPAEGDCQIRRFEGHGTGRFVSATGSIVVVTVIGAERCAELIDKMDGLLK